MIATVGHGIVEESGFAVLPTGESMDVANTQDAKQLDQIDQIIAGRHGDPFAFLGFQQIESRRGIVRAWLPQAKSVALVFSDEPVSMTRVHPSGFFTAPAPGRGYRLRVTLY